MPNQNQWSVFKRLLTYLKPYKFLTFLALAFLLSTTVIKSIIPLWPLILSTTIFMI